MILEQKFAALRALFTCSTCSRNVEEACIQIEGVNGLLSAVVNKAANQRGHRSTHHFSEVAEHKDVLALIDEAEMLAVRMELF